MVNDDFFYTYFIRPIYSGEGYNIFNTIAYAFLLVGILYVFHKVSEKIKFKWDLNSVIATTPYVVLISFARVLTDAGIYEKGFWTVTPGIELLILLPSIFFVFWSYHQFKEKYVKINLVIGSLLCFSQLIFLSYPNPLGPFLISLYLVISIIPLFYLKKRIKILQNDLNFIVMAVHFFDAAATSVSIRFFDYFEQHVLPSFMINIFGPEIMFVLKTIFVGVALYILKDVEDADMIRYVIIFLGLAPGLRDTIRLASMI